MIDRFLSHGSPTLDLHHDKLKYGFDPATNGIFGVYFEGITNLDSRIFSSDLNKYLVRTQDVTNPKVVRDSLVALVRSIDIPEISLKTFNYETIQQFSIKIPTQLDYGGQTATFRFYDTSTGFLLRFFRNWVFALRRPTKDVPAKTDKQSLLKCNAIVFTTDLTLTDITFACGFLGLMPTKIPSDAYSQDVTGRAIVTLSVQMSYDMIVIDDHIFTYAKETLLPMFVNHDGVIQWRSN